MKQWQKKQFISLFLGLAVAGLVLGVYGLGHWDGLEAKSLDLRFHLRDARAPHPDVVIVAIDEESIQALGEWPWSRGVHAKLIQVLKAQGAAAIVFDVIFSERNKMDPAGDEALVKATRSAPQVVHDVFFEVQNGQAQNMVFPFPSLAQASAQVGFPNIFREVDGITRKIKPVIHFSDESWPNLSLVAASLYLKKPWEELVPPQRPLPLDKNGEVLVNFAGGYETFPYVSFHKVLEGQVPVGTFRGKIVLVGSTAAGNYDQHAIPFGQVFPGVEVHANAIANFLQNNFLKPPSVKATVLITLFFGFALGLLLPQLSSRLDALVIPALLGGYFFLCYEALSRGSRHLEFVPPALTIAGTYVAVLFYRYVTEEKEKKWIKGTFGQYVSPKLVENLLDHPEKLKLGGVRREMTVFFSDLAGFTSISESLTPEELTRLLNDYLSEMSDVIFARDGIVNKYMGDAIMAFWNSPLLDQPDHALLACEAALDSMSRLKEFQEKLKTQGLPSIDARIGLNTGPMAVGNMGSRRLFDYTVMGDAVNLGSRLEGANKSFGTHIMISETTYDRVKDKLVARELDLLRVKGKAVPIKVYELIGRRNEVSSLVTGALDQYHKALSVYRSRKFQEAKAAFQVVFQGIPNDPPTQEYLRRVESYLASPPPENWDGVHVMTTK